MAEDYILKSVLGQVSQPSVYCSEWKSYLLTKDSILFMTVIMTAASAWYLLDWGS